jgi:uncharacterized protein YgbK (DUF1537 family)
VKLGCIADDFSGATDLCAALAASGCRVRLVTRLPQGGGSPERQGADAVVVALKSRSVSASEAVELSLAAARWLRGQGAARLYFKYCSTFDSTAEGNIGPVLDALLDELGEKATVVCPANPAQSRTTFMGHLFVGDVLLSDSPLAEHPLNPMRSSSLLELLRPQTPRPLGLIDYDVVRRGPGAIAAEFERVSATACHVVTDAVCEHDLSSIAEGCGHLRLLSGSAGLGAAIGRLIAPRAGSDARNDVPPRPPGPTIVLAGSSSLATRTQLGHIAGLLPVLRLDPLALSRGEATVQEALDWALAHLDGTGLVVAASAPPETVREVQALLGQKAAGELLERALAFVASGLVAAGARRFVVAGGETSAAVVQALEIASLQVCDELETGVPWLRTEEGPELHLALKSGNFGSEAFFERALGPS